MNSEADSLRVKEIFEKAIEFTSTDERQGYVNGTCNGDSSLLARVQTLLRAHFENGESFLPENPGSMPALFGIGDKGEKPGAIIGRYKLLQKIGEGGCGVVWVAEQAEPVRRRVALKVIKLGMDTKAVVARFEAERQALAIMDHPNIAKVHDAGATETGRPFFVMELVRGIPITKYCDENHLTPKARLELLIKVCQAVQHAHQKGIIHRDLKPSNILVTVNDGAPTPKVIDFGIAKATQGRLSDATVYTAFEQFIGTPVYMSPEQAEMGSLDIDTRSDIYSLGVLLYELLTGKPPFDPKAFVEAGVDQIRQHIRQVEPPTPSRRLHTLGEDERTTIARLRGTAPAQLSLVLRGDLDWIVMRCLEKDRTRRYDTANGLAMDIQRHLQNEPVVARPPSTVYLLQKLICRHRVGFAATVAIAAALAAGAIVSTWQAVRATQAEAKAETARRAEAGLRSEAERQVLISRQRAYAADMNLVAKALAEGNLERARELLYRHKPLPGQRDLREWEWRYLWQYCQPDWESVLCENAGEIHSLSISGDGRWLAVAGGHLSVWNLTTRKELPTPLNGRGYTHVAFASRLPLLAAFTSEDASSGPRHRLFLWDLETKKLIREIPLAGACNGLSFSEDSKTLVAATLSPDDQIILWSVADGNVLQTVPAPQLTGPMIQRTTFAATPDLRVAAHVTASGQLRVVDLKSGHERWVAEGADEGSVVGRITFSADGRLIASTAYPNDPTIRVWDTASGKLIQKLHPGKSLLTFALLFWPDGNTLATGGFDQSIRIWDVPSGKQIDMLQGHKAFVTGLALLADNTTLVSGAWDGVVCLWNAKSRRHEEARIELPGPIGAWRFAEDGRSLLTSANNGQITRWQGNDFSERIVELNAGPIVADWRMGQEQFSPDLRYVALQRVEGQVEVWDTFAHRLCQKFDGAIEIFPVAHFRDDHTVRVFDQRSTDSIRCREWDLQNGGVTMSWQIPIHAPLPSVGSTLAWKSPPGTMSPSFLVATFSADGERCLISSAAGKAVVYNLRTRAGEFADVDARFPPRFSPDGNLLASRRERFLGIKLWETATFREIATLPVWTKAPTSVAFSPNGARLAVSNGTGSEGVVLWNPQNYEPVLTLVGNGGFRGTAFSPDGSRLGSRSTFVPDGDGSLHVWRAPTWEEIEAAEELATSSRIRP